MRGHRHGVLIVSFDILGTLLTIKNGLGNQYLSCLQSFLDAHAGRANSLPLTLHADAAVMETVAREAMTAEIKKDRLAFMEHVGALAHRQPLSTQALAPQTQAPTHHVNADSASNSNSSSSSVTECGRLLENLIVSGAVDVAAITPAMMPIGGCSRGDVDAFWRRVLRRAFTDHRLWRGASRSGAPSLSLHTLGIPASDWEELYEHVTWNVFGSSEAYAWLPEGLRTLVKLRQWNAAMVAQRVQQAPCAHAGDVGGAAARGDAGPIEWVLGAPPSAVTNSDLRMRTALFELVQRVEADLAGGRPSVDDEMRSLSAAATVTAPAACAPLPPLLQDVISAEQLGLGKPSALGLMRCVCLAGAATDRAASPMLHLHVGDAEADRQACERAPHRCVYVPCDPAVGARWEDLLRVIETSSSGL